MFSQLGLGESMDLSKRLGLQKLDSLLQEICILDWERVWICQNDQACKSLIHPTGGVYLGWSV